MRKVLRANAFFCVFFSSLHTIDSARKGRDWEYDGRLGHDYCAFTLLVSFTSGRISSFSFPACGVPLTSRDVAIHARVIGGTGHGCGGGIQLFYARLHPTDNDSHKCLWIAAR